MNRRDALKKLAVGGAIAAGGSLVLSSNPVAATNSGGIPDGIPGPDGPFDIELSNSKDEVWTLTAPAPPNGVSVAHSWNIQSFKDDDKKIDAIRLTSKGVEQTLSQNRECAPPGCPYFLGNETADLEAISIEDKDDKDKDDKHKDKDKDKDGKRKFKKGDVVIVGLLAEWSFRGGSMTAEFVVTVVVGRGATTKMVPGSYRVT